MDNVQQERGQKLQDDHYSNLNTPKRNQRGLLKEKPILPKQKKKRPRKK